MGFMDALFDKEGLVSNTIEECLLNVSEEINCKPTEMFIMIKPIRDEFLEEHEIPNDECKKNFKCWIYNGKTGQKVIRVGKENEKGEISLKEILGD